MQRRPETELRARPQEGSRKLARRLRACAASVAAVLAALVLALAGGRGEADAAAAQQVTLRLSQYRNANGVLVTVFSGTIPSSAAGQVVDIVGQDCGTRGFRLIASARSEAGGVYQAENPEQVFPWRSTPVSSGIVFKARWNDELSPPVAYRTPAPLSVRKVGRRAWRVYTGPPAPWTVSMKGKIVELQRRVGRTWHTVQRARLALKPRYAEYGGAFNHEVVFTVPRQGWTLRAVLPPRSAFPCYLAGVSSTWRS